MNKIAGKKIKEQHGMVSSSYVASKVFYRDFVAQIRTFLGLEVVEYTKMMDHARFKAIKRLKQQAENMGANAVLNVRFVTSATSLMTAEILVYGDAVLVV